jgi:hypothetical protein
MRDAGTGVPAPMGLMRINDMDQMLVEVRKGMGT